MHLTLLPGEFSVWRLAPDAPLPSIKSGNFLSVTHTDDELSIVTESMNVPTGATSEDDWRCLKVEGHLAFEMTGVLAGLSAPLAHAAIPIFVVSTYDTDYLLVKGGDLERTRMTLLDEGFVVDFERK